jgi:hypothetical protein
MNMFKDPDGGNPDKDKCLGENYVGPGKLDTQVQLVISLSLGLSAFFAFCVGPLPPSTFYLPHTHSLLTALTVTPGSPPTMEDALRRPKTTLEPHPRPTRAARHLLWMDPRTLQDYRAAGPLLGRTRCLRLPGILQDVHAPVWRHVLLRRRRARAHQSPFCP